MRSHSSEIMGNVVVQTQATAVGKEEIIIDSPFPLATMEPQLRVAMVVNAGKDSPIVCYASHEDDSSRVPSPVPR